MTIRTDRSVARAWIWHGDGSGPLPAGGTALILLLAAIVGGPAKAQPVRCGERIAALASAERDLTVGLHARQSVDAQLHHQPTPGTIAGAQSEAKRAHIATVLTAARRLDTEGKEAECLATLRKGGLLP